MYNYFSGMPFFADQIKTLSKSIALGVAVKLEFRSLSVENFKKAILIITENAKYEINAKRISKLFRDKPQKPLDLAIWWVEYVIRNPSPDHMRSPTLNMTSLAVNSYDVLIIFVLSLYVFVFIICKIVKVFKLKIFKFKKE